MPTAVPPVRVLATSTPASNGTFTIQLPQSLVNGTISLVAEDVDVVGNPGPGNSPVVTVTETTVGSDFSGNLLDYKSTPQTFPVPASSVNQAIPSATAGLVSSQVQISGQSDSVTIGSLSVMLNIAHPSDGFLTAYLIGPDGKTQVTLFSLGTLAGANLTGTTFSDAATASLSSGTAPYTGVFKPSDPAGLALLNNQSLNGTWTLQVIDNVTGSAGTLINWSLVVTPAAGRRAAVVPLRRVPTRRYPQRHSPQPSRPCPSPASPAPARSIRSHWQTSP